MGTLRAYQEDILNRTRDAFRQGYHRPCIVLCCGGGKSCIVAEMAKGAVEKGGHVLFLVHREELCAQIRRTFFEWGVPMHGSDICMVQTATRRINRLERPTLIITDENHHCLAGSYRRIYDAFPDVPLVGVTATPCRLNGGGLGDVNDVLIEGPGTKWLIDNGYLAPFDYYAPVVTDLTGLRISHGEYVASEIAERMNRQAIHGEVLSTYHRLAEGRKAIVYCASIAHSKAVAEAFTQAGIPAAHIDGDTPDTDRKRIVQQFREGDIRILTNVDLISEGFDVPDCGASILLRPTKSLTLYIQQSMRCMRYVPGKRAIIIDHVGNYAWFGLPDAAREWTLEPKKAGGERDIPSPHTCPKCFGAFDQYALPHNCPYCGESMPIKAREIEEIRETAMSKIEGFVIHYDSPKQCRNYDELLAYARRKNYKPGWAWYQAKTRGFIA